MITRFLLFPVERKRYRYSFQSFSVSLCLYDQVNLSSTLISFHFTCHLILTRIFLTKFLWLIHYLCHWTELLSFHILDGAYYAKEFETIDAIPATETRPEPIKLRAAPGKDKCYKTFQFIERHSLWESQWSALKEGSYQTLVYKLIILIDHSYDLLLKRRRRMRGRKVFKLEGQEALMMKKGRDWEAWFISFLVRHSFFILSNTLLLPNN